LPKIPSTGLRAYGGRGSFRCRSEDNVASLNLLIERLQTIFRGEPGLARDVVEQSVGVVKHLASAVRETQLEMRGLKALMDTMSEKSTNSQRRTGHSTGCADDWFEWATDWIIFSTGRGV